MSAHTPGPWTVEFAEHGGYDCMTDAFCIGARVGGGWPAPIAKLDLSHYGQSQRSREVLPMSRQLAEANARLIAAAPDLLAALKVAEGYMHLWMEDFTGKQELADLEQVEAAIAKAEGKDSV